MEERLLGVEENRVEMNMWCSKLVGNGMNWSSSQRGECRQAFDGWMTDRDGFK